MVIDQQDAAVGDAISFIHAARGQRDLFCEHLLRPVACEADKIHGRPVCIRAGLPVASAALMRSGLQVHQLFGALLGFTVVGHLVRGEAHFPHHKVEVGALLQGDERSRAAGQCGKWQPLRARAEARAGRRRNTSPSVATTAEKDSKEAVDMGWVSTQPAAAAAGRYPATSHIVCRTGSGGRLRRAASHASAIAPAATEPSSTRPEGSNRAGPLMSVRPRIAPGRECRRAKQGNRWCRGPPAGLAPSRIVNASRNTASTSPTTLSVRAGAGASAIAVVASILTNYSADGVF